jgi:hypothetical protein
VSARRWSPAELDVMRRHYADRPTAAIAAQLGRTVGQVYQCAERNGLRKSAAYLASPEACRLRRGDNVGAESRFKPGQAPHNDSLTGGCAAPAENSDGKR